MHESLSAEDLPVVLCVDSPNFWQRILRCAVVTLLLLSAGSSTSLAQEEADEAPDYSRSGADTCFRCHGDEADDPVYDIFKTRHAVPTDKRSPFGQLQCESCHGPGGAHTGRVRRGQEQPKMRGFGSESHTPVAEQNEVCEGCHSGDVGPHWQSSEHSLDDISCADCHQVHTPRDPVLATGTQPEICFDCHKQQKTDSYKFSTHPIRYGKMACSDCHNPHGSVADAALNRNNLNETCYSCHTEKRGPFLFEHAPVPEDCSNCHRPHGSNHAALLTKRAPLLCQQCHSQDGHPSRVYTSGGLANGNPNSFLIGRSCMNCHAQVHGSNHPSGVRLDR